MKVLDERYSSLAEVKKILEKKNKEYKSEDKELLYEQRRALDHARTSSKLKLNEIDEMINKLRALDLGLPEDQLTKICNLLPETVDDIRAIFAKERFKYNEEEIKKIIDIVDQYR